MAQKALVLVLCGSCPVYLCRTDTGCKVYVHVAGSMNLAARWFRALAQLGEWDDTRKTFRDKPLHDWCFVETKF
jgi:hypothetical protein